MYEEISSSIKYRTTHEYQYKSSTRYIQTQNTKEQETKLCVYREFYKMCFMN